MGWESDKGHPCIIHNLPNPLCHCSGLSVVEKKKYLLFSWESRDISQSTTESAWRWQPATVSAKTESKQANETGDSPYSHGSQPQHSHYCLLEIPSILLYILLYLDQSFHCSGWLVWRDSLVFTPEERNLWTSLL